jgi:hypothetical protein
VVIEIAGFIKGDKLRNCQFLRTDSAPCCQLLPYTIRVLVNNDTAN